MFEGNKDIMIVFSSNNWKAAFAHLSQFAFCEVPHVWIILWPSFGHQFEHLTLPWRHTSQHGYRISNGWIPPPTFPLIKSEALVLSIKAWWHWQTHGRTECVEAVTDGRAHDCTCASGAVSTLGPARAGPHSVCAITITYLQVMSFK